jgi:hypothetical protein
MADWFSQNAPKASNWFNQNAPAPEEASPPVPHAPIPNALTGPSSPNYAGMALKAGEGLKDLGIGALKGAASTANNIGHMLYPDAIAKHLTGAPSAEQQESYFAPKNTAQSIGKGAEQIGEFLLPGGAEERGAAKLAELTPKLGAMAKPLARALTSGVSSGAVNAAQGGSFGTGAALGAGGSALSEGVKLAAPAIAESALNIRKLDRAYGKKGGAIGRAILDETKGITPGKVAESAQTKLDELNPMLNAAADRASIRFAPRIKGFLQPPITETPLHVAGGAEGRLSEPIVLTQPDRPTRRLLQSPSLSTPMAPGHQTEFPQRLASGRMEFGEPASGLGHAQYIGEIPGEMGGPAQVQGVLRSRPPMSASIPNATEANPSASLGPARSVLGRAFGTAARQGERTTANQLQPMATHLGETISGEPIPENVTPRQLLDLKRGFGNEFIHRWNPETMTGVKGTAARTYRAMGDEFNRTVPEGAELNGRVSNLIPVAKRAASEELNAPTGQKVFHRVAAHTGALTLGAGLGMEGYREGGLPKALAYGGIGVLAPELIASPEGQMAIARSLNSNAPKRLVKALTGAGLTGSRQGRGQ